MKHPYPSFFFGATSRPLMIGLSPDFTYFDLVFCDCTGPDDMAPHRGINLRSAAEVARCAEWLRAMSWPTECRAEELRLPGFSPELADESFEGHYDATELHLYGVWRMDQDDGLCFHLAPDPETPVVRSGCYGYSFHAAAAFCGGSGSDRMADDSLDLSEDQPLND